MILLDTDHISVLQFDSSTADALKQRLISAKQPIATTVITLEEQCKSWISRLGRQKTVHDQVPYYSRLVAMFEFFAEWEVVDFNEQAAAEFEQFRKQRVRIATTDLKIASIAFAGDFLLLTANSRDFQSVPGLRFESWLEN